MIELIKLLIRHPFTTINSRKELRYLVAGSASEALEYISFLLLMVATNRLYLSNSISFILGVISGFIFHKTWSFRGEQQFKTHQQFVGYVSLAAVNFVVINLLVGLLVNHWHLHPALGKLVAIVITVVWTFTISNFIIFKHTKDTSTQA